VAKTKFATALLVLLNVTLVALTLFVWSTGQDRIHQPDQIAARRLELPDLGALDVRPSPAVDLTAMREDAVFHSRRSFFHPPLPSQVIPAPEYDFAGTMSLPQGKRIAFVKKKSDRTNRTVHVGDDLDGWRVETIESTRVVVFREDQHYELKSNTAAPALGLVRGDAGQRIVESGIRVLGSRKAETFPLPHEAVTSVRTYRPPPP
jgi:hypothetical protein